jgi:serine/threonine protein kinase
MLLQYKCRCGYQWPAESGPGAADVHCPKCGSAATSMLEATIDASDITASVSPEASYADSAAPTLTAGEPHAGVERTLEIPGYAILGELGRGGMGVVYRSRETALNRPVALKVLLAGSHAGARDLARFRAEAEAAAAIQHGNVVQVYAVGQHDGLPFMAQELVPGGSLAARLATGPMSANEAARVVLGIARGVAAAHERGVVHRDLKPANVLFAPTGDPKVADFGLAKLGDSGLTASGAIMGTPAYMSPEQARGDTKAAGPPADIWALGAILYECLAGSPPFKGQSAPDTLRLVCEAEPESIGQSARSVPKDLETIALKCLEKEPNRRYISAGAMADDLAHYLAGEPVSARPRGPVARLARWTARHKGPVYVVAGALLAVAITYAVYPPSTPEAKPAPVADSQPLDDPDEPSGPEKVGAVGRVQVAADRMNSSNNLKQLAIAAHNMSATYGRLPTQAIYDVKTGKALLSWRVAYLPFIEQDALYKRFNLNEPWDSPHNLPMVEEMPKIFRVPTSKAPKGHTHYQVFTGPGTLFDPVFHRPFGPPLGKLGISFGEITDGTATTMLIAEGAKAVPWTKPEDLEVSPDRPLPALGGLFEGGYLVAMVNGQVLFVRDTVTEETLRAVLSPRGNEIVPADWSDGPQSKSAGKK